MAEVCNLCGKELNIYDKQENFTITNSNIGYGSIHDGEACNCKLCCKCFDKVMGSLEFSVDPFIELEYTQLNDEQIAFRPKEFYAEVDS